MTGLANPLRPLFFALFCLFGLWACGGVDGAKSTSDTGAYENDASHGSDVSHGVNEISTGGDSTGSDPEGDTGDGTPLPEPSPEVDPGCVDGQYTESLPTVDADISDLTASYTQENLIAFIDAVLDRRYPVGGAALKGGYEAKNSGFGSSDCVATFLQNKGTASQVISSLSTLVHECGHAYDISLGGFAGAAYFFTPETQFTCQGGSIPDFGGKTFARSLIKQDPYSALHSPCAGFRDTNCDDTYAAIYLDGDPDNDAFESGDQGFDMLLEETVQYVNSLATDYAFSEYVMGAVSARDGILTFLWYLERYLRMARLEYPDTYAHLTGDACWRQAVLTTWGRAWIFISLTEKMGSLGIDDAKLIGLVRDADLLDEIQRVRDAEGCP